MRFWLVLLSLLLSLPGLTSAEQILRGTLTEQGSGFVIPGATVLLEVTDMRIRRQVGFETLTTDANGRYTIDLQPKYGEIPTLGIQINAYSPGHRQALKIEKPTPADFPLTVDLELFPGCSARGRVIRSDGQPIADAVVEGSGARRTRTDLKGEFQIFGLAAESPNILIVRKEGFVQGRKELEAAPQGEISGIEIVLASGADLTVKVRAPGGKRPVIAGTVVLQFPGRFLQQRLDSTGEVRFEGVPLGEEPELRYMGPQFLLTPRPLSDKEIEGGTLEVELLPAVFLQGTLEDAKGRPTGAQQVFLEFPDADERVSLPVGTGGIWRSGPIPPSTRVRILAMPGGSLATRGAGELEFLPPDDDGVQRAEVNPWPEGHVSRFTVRQDADGRVEMQRRDEGKGALPGTIRYVGKMDAAGGQLTGEIFMEGTMKPGRFTARAYNPNGRLEGVWDLREELPPQRPTGPGHLDVTTAPFPGRQVVVVRMTDAASLSGMAQAADGTPVTRGTALISGWRSVESYAVTAPIAEGVFFLEGLPREPVELIVVDQLTGEQTLPMWVVPDGQQLTIKFGESDEDPMDSLSESKP